MDVDGTSQTKDIKIEENNGSVETEASTINLEQAITNLDKKDIIDLLLQLRKDDPSLENKIKDYANKYPSNE
jgi:hypothetical protein